METPNHSAADSSAEASPPLPFMARLRRLQEYFGQQKLAWGVALFATLVTALTEPLIAALLQPLLDKGFTQGALDLWMVPLAIVGVFLVRGVAQFISQYALARIANEGMLRLRTALFERMLVADMALFTQQSASALSNTVVYEVQNGFHALVHALLGLSRDGFTLLALLGYLLYLNWQLTLVVALMAPAVAWIMKTLSRRLYTITKNSQQATDALAYVVEENVLARHMVRLHRAQHQQAGRFHSLSQQLRRLAMKSTIASAAMTPTTQLLAAVALSCVICLALWQGRNGGAQEAVQSVTVGGFAAFIAAMLMLIAPIRRLADVANPLTRGVAALERGLRLLAEAQPESSGSHRTVRAHGSIALHDVSVVFDADRPPALAGVTLSIQPGEIVALVGPSGAGKSTLANLLPRFVTPSSGTVLLDGVPLQQWSLPNLRAQFALVSQDVVMLNDSIAANVALGTSIDEARVHASLTAANLGDYVKCLPQGIHTTLGHNASQLSGGQRQRLAIARALYKNAPILILDEATSALDVESERLVQEALQRLMRRRTTLVIAHRLSTIEHAHRVVVMEHGQIVEQGTHARLLATQGLYARLQNQ